MSSREGFVFYRSFYNAINALPDDKAMALFKALCTYALDGKETDLEQSLEPMWYLIRPQLDANEKRYEAGRKGGRPKKTNAEITTDVNDAMKRRPKLSTG